MNRPKLNTLAVLAGVGAAVSVGAIAVVAFAADRIGAPADLRERPQSAKTEILPEKFLRGFDPITVYYTGERGPGQGPADDVARLARLVPSWPGAWSWLDRRTLQFRPAEPWPALQRFSVESEGAARVLSTMMTAPAAMQPPDGADGLRPFRTFSLTFPQPLPLEALKTMLKVEVRDLPGLADSPRIVIDELSVAELPRRTHKDPASYAVTMANDVGEGRQLVVTLALALGEEGKALWTGRASTRTAFSLLEVSCGGDRLGIVASAKVREEQALDCGSQGEAPQLVFSSTPQALTMTALRKLVRLEPAVPDLSAGLFGKRVSLQGRFVPDTLYRMRLAAAPVQDEELRALADPGDVELFFYVGWKKPFLRFREGQSVLEARGPRMVPLVGYGEPRADVRVHRVDPLHPGLWPFPSTPVVVNEEAPPPFPGEEPALPEIGGARSAEIITPHLRMLGSPLVSRVFDLPLVDKGGTTSFGLEIGAALDGVVGARLPGTYLVGLRRLQGPPERAWVRVQVTNLTLTAVEERAQAVLFVRTLDGALPVRGARVAFDALDLNGRAARLELTTDEQGKATLAPQAWSRIARMVVSQGDDVLVLDPQDPPPRFFQSHWAPGGSWLSHVLRPIPPLPNDRHLGFLFSERPIYRPGEKVFLKGFARDKRGGLLQMPALGSSKLHLKVHGPGDQEWVVKSNVSALFGVDGTWEEKDAPTGRYTATLMRGAEALASRTFQVEAYRIPTFEVQLSGPSAARLDEPFKVRAVGRYYAGGTVAAQPIRWSVTRRPHHYVPVGRPGFLFASSAQFARPESRPADARTERSAALDDNGADAMEINPALDLDGSPRVYRIEATVTGADDQEVSAVTEVPALPPFVLGLKIPRFSKSALDLKPEIIAVGVDDKLIAGQKVTVRLHKRTWHSHLRESSFSLGTAQYVTEQEDKKIAELEVVTGKDAVRAALPVAEAGVYLVEISARDKLGRLQTLTADLYVGGREPQAWQKPQAGVFDLATDKDDYLPGETAHLVIKSPWVKAQALVIVEEPAGNRYSFVAVVNGAATVDVAIRKEHLPNLPVHVVLMRGRLGESASDDTAYKPQTLAASAELEVKPAKSTVQVAVKHPESARPGEVVPLALSLTDDKGVPLAGEVTLWLVDEAVLALAAEGTLDPLSAMVVRNQQVTSVLDTRNRTVGKLLEEEAPGGDGSEREEQAGVAHRRVRKNFQSVPYWQATVLVPASGKLTVPVKLSDDLTNFMVRAVAVSGAERFGFTESRLRVRLPVLVQPQLPRFARQGDRFDGGAVARVVEGPDGPAVVKAELTGPVVERKRSRDVTISSSKAASVVFPIEVASGPATTPLKVRMDVTRKSDGVGDAFEVTIPVLPDRSFESVERMETWQPGKRTLPAPPETPRAGTTRHDLVVTSTPGVLEAFAALQYLEEYPHGCLEQKMSQLMPQLALAELSGALGGYSFAAGARDHVARLVDELAAHQADSGLFGYWPGTPGHLQLTADALDFILAAEKLGVRVDERVKARALDALRRSLRSDYGSFVSGYRYNEQSAALRALFSAGSWDDHYLVDLFRTRRALDATSRAELALSMLSRKSVFASDLKSLNAELWDSVVFKLDRGKRVFTGLSDPRSDWGGAILGSSTSEVATVLLALSESDPKNPDLAPLFDGLLQRTKPGRGFGSTYDSRRAVQAIVAYLQHAQPGTASSKVVAQGGGKTVELVVADRPKVARGQLLYDGGPALEVSGAPLRARVRTTYLPMAGGDKVAAQKSGFAVTRSMTVIPVDGSSAQRSDDVRAAERELKVGDVVEIHVTVTTDVPRSNVALVVPIAAGLEPLNAALKTASSEAMPTERDTAAPSYVQRLDHEARYYFDRLPKGTFSVHFRVKATTPGSYTHPAAYAELMYDEAVRGRSDGMRVIVTRGAEQGTP